VTSQDAAVPIESGKRYEMRLILARYGLIVLLVILAIVFETLRPSFLSFSNINGQLRSASISAIMFLGLTWVMAAGEIDASFMSVAAMTNMIVAGTVASGHGWVAASLCGLAASLVAGGLNGFLVAYLGLPGLVTTIATGGFAGAIAAAIGRGSSLSLGSTGFLGSFLGASVGAIPLVTVVVVVLYACAWMLQEKLTFGRYIYALEQNRAAVTQAGVPAERLLILLYSLSGFFSGLAGILLAADLASGQPYIGTSYFVDGFTAVLLGGMVLKLAKPNVLGTIVGVLFLAVLLSGSALLGWNDAQRQVMKGCLLLVGVAAVILARQPSRRRART
jgi:ribose transport system permease protein